METIKIWWILGCILCMSTYGTAQYISEFHYDNVGADEGEFIEVVFLNPQPGDLSLFRIYIYNGSDSMVHDDRSIEDILPNCELDSCFYVWTKQSLLQNDTEAIALVYVGDPDTSVLEFISYEGVIEALDGPAMGMTSEDVGVVETGTTPVDWSIQLDSTGTWITGPATPGSINPIELLTFTGKFLPEEEGVLLEWLTASELNNKYFEIQRSIDQISFVAIGTIEGAMNSQDTLRYSFLDIDPMGGQSFYRLKQVDLDGAHTYSAMIAVTCPIHNSLTGLVPVFQNQELSFADNNFQDQINISIYDNQGRLLVYRKNVRTTEVIPLDVAGRGIIYFLIRSGEQMHSGPLLTVSR